MGNWYTSVLDWYIVPVTFKKRPKTPENWYKTRRVKWYRM